MLLVGCGTDRRLIRLSCEAVRQEGEEGRGRGRGGRVEQRQGGGREGEGSFGGQGNGRGWQLSEQVGAGQHLLHVSLEVVRDWTSRRGQEEHSIIQRGRDREAKVSVHISERHTVNRTNTVNSTISVHQDGVVVGGLD